MGWAVLSNNGLIFCAISCTGNSACNERGFPIQIASTKHVLFWMIGSDVNKNCLQVVYLYNLVDYKDECFFDLL